jgi:hypothetical protein
MGIKASNKMHKNRMQNSAILPLTAKTARRDRRRAAKKARVLFSLALHLSIQLSVED